MKEINEGKHYKDQYSSFESYCKDRWGISRDKAYRLIFAYDERERLSSIGNTILPINESQTRILKRLKGEEDRAQCWKNVVEKANGEKITARLISEVVDEMIGSDENKQEIKKHFTNVKRGITGLSKSLSNFDTIYKNLNSEHEKIDLTEVNLDQLEELISRLQDMKGTLEGEGRREKNLQSTKVIEMVPENNKTFAA